MQLLLIIISKKRYPLFNCYGKKAVKSNGKASLPFFILKIKRLISNGKYNTMLSYIVNKGNINKDIW